MTAHSIRALLKSHAPNLRLQNYGGSAVNRISVTVQSTDAPIDDEHLRNLPAPRRAVG